jgi:hypothetical protein
MTELINEVRRSTANPGLIPEGTECDLRISEVEQADFKSGTHLKTFSKVFGGEYAGWNIVHSLKLYQVDGETGGKYIGGMLAQLLDAIELLDGVNGKKFKSLEKLMDAMVGKMFTARIRQTDKTKSPDGVVRNRLTQDTIQRYRTPEERSEIRRAQEAIVKQRQEAAQQESEKDFDDIPF